MHSCASGRRAFAVWEPRDHVRIVKQQKKRQKKRQKKQLPLRLSELLPQLLDLSSLPIDL